MSKQSNFSSLSNFSNTNNKSGNMFKTTNVNISEPDNFRINPMALSSLQNFDPDKFEDDLAKEIQKTKLADERNNVTIYLLDITLYFLTY